MKKYVWNLVTVILVFFALTVKSQALLPNQQLLKAPVNTEDNFIEMQQQFNDYWDPKNVVNGYYEENGVQKKAYGWKQFKRWEWYWNNRVDPTTGQFPDQRASDFYVERAKTSTGRNATGNWTAMGPSLSSGGYSGLGRLNCIAFRPGDNSVFYVGAPSGGLWKTTDGGSSWNVLTDQNAVLGVSDAIVIAGATTNSDVVYIATGDRDGGSMWSLGGGQWHDNNSVGVLKSVDGGSTWNTTGLSFNSSQKETVNRLLLDTDDNNTLYAATSDGFYRTTDAGVNWSNLYSTEFVDIEFNPGNDQIIYGSSRWGEIYLSTDGGVSWTLEMDNYSSGGRRIDLAVSAAQPTWVYAVEVNSSGGLFGVYKSTNSGASYSLLYNTLNLLGSDCDGVNSGGQGSYDLAIAADPNDANKVFVGGVNTWETTDGGLTWNISNMWSGTCSGAAINVHADKHFFAYQNGTSTVFECNDGGIYKSSNHGSTWTHLSNGLEISQLYRLAVAQTTNNDVIAGLQDCGTKSMRSGTWTDVIGGDGMDCMIDYTNEYIQYGEYQNGGLYRTTDKWTSSFTNITSGLTGTANWVMPIAIDPNVNTTIYAGRQDVFKSTDQGSNWTQISSWSGNSLTELAVAPSNSNYIYATTQSILYRTTDGGTNWSDITGTLPTGSALITYMAIKDDDPNTVWVSMGQYDANGVYKTTDGGATWTNISSGLPTIPVMCVVQNIQNTTQTELYAGTDVGIYVKVGGGAWALYSDGLPNVVVNELKIYYNTTTPSLSRLRAATSGRGMWESELYSPPNSPPVADFVGDVLSPGVGQTVTFSDLSTNVPTSWLWSFTPSTVTYVGGTSATSQNPQVQFNAEGDYTVQLTATNAYGSDSENKSDYITIAALQTYCAASSNSSSATGNPYISGVQIGTVNNTGTGSNAYTNYTSLSANVTVNQSNNITITVALVGYTSNYYNPDADIGIWIDWNQNGDFTDTGENITCQSGMLNTQGVFSFLVPADALLGQTTMRVRVKYFDADCGLPCGTTTYGEVEDYKIVVLPATNSWIGTSTDWNSASNWSDNTVPTSSYNITIPTTPSGGNFPDIPVGITAKCNTLTIESGATITVNGTLEVEK